MSDRTKLWIADKMKSLMEKKSLDKIRVTEICREAQIERQTFYYHFRDKYDLVAWIFVHNSLNLDVIDVKSAALNISSMKQEYLSSQAINNITSVKTCREVVDELNILA